MYESMEALPEECMSHVISLTSPIDACRSSLVSTIFRDAADSDLVWKNFLPSDYLEVISRSVSPVKFSSKKDLYRKLSSAPLLIDGGKKTFSIDKRTNNKCYMLSARELSITWASNSLYWCWKRLLHSRFSEAAELIMVCWLEIHGKINTKLLSPNTTYGVYLVIQLADRAFGLGDLPSEVSVEVGNQKTRGTIYVKHGVQGLNVLRKREEPIVSIRGDGWLEVELGDFYNDGSEKEVKTWFREVKGEHLKGGLIVEGIEIRPKH
ncbi:hypothetical protein BUALT_Bualt19G0067000 [Buddleja alternifolia]|uniref:F-box domain-containing protein n=1 Tax=Buddleja alternifolia TaxID=168488 RepID=A0AAV6WA74_9LAMI|nr:hypothetical protein BUALT_Bualt19G0067000 [Buddleja alternifolia]